MGFVNNLYKVIIAPSCSGVRFMIVTFATLLYSFVHRMKTMRTGFLWLALSLAFSYLYTVFVNGIRITVSIFIRMSDNIGWMTPEKFHTLEGIAIYFIALIAAFQIAGHVSLWLSGQMVSRCATLKQFLLCRCVPPAFWYFAFTLGIPLARGAYSGNPGSFIAYTTLMLFAFMTIIFLLCLIFVFRKRIKS